MYEGDIELKHVWLLAVVLLWALGHVLARAGSGTSAPTVIAHRGAAGVAPENTLAAIRAGRHSGAAFIEVDVQRTLDGVLVLLHDRTVDRTTDGSGPVDELTLAQLQALDAGGWFAGRFAGQPVPTLKQALVELEGWGGTLVVEAKHPDAHPGLARDLASCLQQYPNVEFTFVSFDHEWLQSFVETQPSASFGELSVYPLALPADQRAERVGVFWLAPILDPTLVWRAHRRGLEVWVWTVDHPWLMDALAWLGVDAITTNYPDRAQDSLSR